MEASTGTIVALYYVFFTFVYYLIAKAKDFSRSIKLLLSVPSILFVTLFPSWLDTSLFFKFLLTLIGFFSSFNIVDLVFLDPPLTQPSVKEFIFFLSTSSRPVVRDQEATPSSTAHPSFNVGRKASWRLFKATAKLLVFSMVFESIQKMDLSEKSYLAYYILMYLLGGSLYLCFTVILDVVGLFWEVVFNMRPKDLFNAPFFASSPRDFWSRRWNMFFRDFFHKVFFRNLKQKPMSYWRTTVYALSIFAISGVLHEYVYWSIMGKISGLNFMFFMLHGVAATSQAIIQTVFPILRQFPRAIGIVVNNIFIAVTIPLFVGPYVQSGFVHDVNIPISLPFLNTIAFNVLNSV